MAKEINLTSQKWNDMIFEGKNKDYGAYEMRQSSSKRHVKSLIIILALVILITFLPFIIKNITPSRRADNLSESTVLADLQKELEEKNIIRELEPPPPPPLKSTIQFTVPEIVSAKDMVEEDEIKSQDELNESQLQVSVADVEGVDDGIDIADLQQHKVIAEVTDDVLDFVEQMPQFPGGDKELNKYLTSKTDYPDVSITNRIQGRVTVKFVIEKDGSVTDVSVERGVDRNLDAEAIRVVKSMPKWIPGKQNGQSVRVRYRVPVIFRLYDDD